MLLVLLTDSRSLASLSVVTAFRHMLFVFFFFQLASPLIKRFGTMAYATDLLKKYSTVHSKARSRSEKY